MVVGRQSDRRDAGRRLGKNLKGGLAYWSSQLALRRPVPLWTKAWVAHNMNNAQALSIDRYLHRGSYRPQTDHEFYDYMYGQSRRDFKANFKMSRQQFNDVLAVIDGHPVFDDGGGCKTPSRPPQFQLLVWLYYIGTKGATPAK